MATYLVRLVSTNPRREYHEYVTAPDTNAGYAKARRNAEKKLAKKQPTIMFKAVESRCVG